MTTRTLGSTIGSVFNAVGSVADATSNAIIASSSGINALAYKADAWEMTCKDQAEFAKSRSRVTAELESARILRDLLKEIHEENSDPEDKEFFDKALELQKAYFAQKKS